ncbi:MAG TPA: ThuA domain-containing protein [Opitutaceae bacterium]
MSVHPMKKLFIIAALTIATASGLLAKEPSVLVYTRNYTPDGKGYVHDNIATGVAMLKQLGAENGFAVDATEDPAVFTDANLANYAALIFANSNNEAFATDAQRAAFERYIHGGGGFVGIHSASGSERAWPFYWATVGGKFKRHPPIQPFDVEVLETAHPAAAHLNAVWRWEDEFYYHDNLNPRARVILAGRLTGLNDPKLAEYPGAVFGELFPLAWCFEEHGGRRFYTALGHKIEYYADANFRRHVLGGVLWVLRVKD